MKKIIVLFAVLSMVISMSCISSFAATYVGTFTDFEDYPSFEKGGDFIYNEEEPKDYWSGAWDSYDPDFEFPAVLTIVDGKGYNGSKGLEIYQEDTPNSGVYLFATEKNKIPTNYSGAKYLRVWVDFTNVEFRKANFGAFNKKAELYTTDEENSVTGEWPFYYLPEKSTEWQEFFHGGDGCFGDVQDTPIMGFKGWMAFPLEDFVIRNNANPDLLEPDTPMDYSDVYGIYLFWDYSDGDDYVSKPFYIDELQFVKDYKVFEEIPVPVAEPEPEETKPVSDNPTTSDSDSIYFILAAITMLGAISVIYKKVRA